MNTLTLPLVAGTVYGEGPFYAMKCMTGDDPDVLDVIWTASPLLPHTGAFRWATHEETPGEHIVLDAPTVAELLFALDVDPDRLDEAGIREAVDHALTVYRCDALRCAGGAYDALDSYPETAPRLARCRARAAQVTGTETAEAVMAR
jgi:hypothetical protein